MRMIKRMWIWALLMICLILPLGAKNLYVLNSSSQTLTEVNLETDAVNNSYLGVGLYSNQVYLTGDMLWVVNSGDNNIKGYIRETGNLIKSYNLENSANPWNMIEQGDYYYITGMMTNKLYRINKTSEEITSLEVGIGPEGMLVFGNRLYVACTGYEYPNFNPGKVSVVDLGTFTKTQEIAVSTNPQGIVGVGTDLYVICTGNYGSETGKLVKIDPVTNSVMNTINIGGSPNNIFKDNSGKIWLGDGMGAGFMVFDTQSQTVINNSANPLYAGGSVILFDGDMKYILKSSFSANSSVEVRNSSDDLVKQFTCAIGAVDMKLFNAGSANNDFSEVKPSLLFSYPNPFRENVTIKAQDEQTDEILLYNLKGQRVLSVRGNVLNWNGKNSEGQVCGSGIYFCIAKKEGAVIAKKSITLIK